MTTSIGILIVGSLYWDDQPHRQTWRTERLKMDEIVRVRAPIRYGRKSSTRGDTYTMVFSRELDHSKDKLGFALIAPCKKLIDTSQNLIDEAEALWCAERPPNAPGGGISATWGNVAIIQNPDNPLPANILEAWEGRVGNEENYGHVKHSKNESSIIQSSGLLNVSWPDDAPNSYSALLATATNPTLIEDEYPSIDLIAGAWNTANGRGYRNYFLQNKKNNICTFQDEEISQKLDHTAA